MESIQKSLKTLCQDLFKIDVEPKLTRPDEQFGDFATNVALQLAAKTGQKPQEIAQKIATALVRRTSSNIKTAEVAGPGFINITLKDEALWEIAKAKPQQSLAGKTVVAEYSDPNPFKILHAGHLYTSVVGDAIANLLEVAGAKVHRVNFGGDVGRHVAITMWAILQELGGENPGKLTDVAKDSRSQWLADAYIKGTLAYEDDETIKDDVINLNKRIYQLHSEGDKTSPLAQIYWTTRQWSYDYFEEFYKRIGSQFEKYYPESAVAELGLQTVKEQLEKGVFEESDSAVIFNGEKYGLHTRVFINSEGLPTYEAKDIGLVMTKWQDYHFDKSVVITGNEQAEYMSVVLKAVEQFQPELAKATTHLTHGIVKLMGGQKMSSRRGNILKAVDVLDTTEEASRKISDKTNQDTVLAAVKYAFLTHRLGGDIIYDPKESVAIEGNSGPYLQYAHARARSILAKSTKESLESHEGLEPMERSLVRKIGEYAEVVDKAVQELLPSYITTYLYELAQEFNRFYEKNRVIDDPRQALRLKLVQNYADTLKNGLELLGITAPLEM